MYYRRKVILALLQKFGGELRSDRLQQLLFLFTREQKKSAYEFVPSPKGPFSYHARYDKGAMIKNDLLKNKGHWALDTDEDSIRHLNNADQQILEEIYLKFKEYDAENLITYICRHYPFYAFHSEVCNNDINKEELKEPEPDDPSKNEQKLYTIGYEGIKAEAYMNKLLRKGVNLLVDVRKNSMSRKFGFNKSRLKEMCESLGMEFRHFPGLGIASDKRKNVDSKEDYNKLFDEYEYETLPQKSSQLEKLHKLCVKFERVVITCFEKEHTLCHRHRISNWLKDKWGLSVVHL